MSTQEQAPTPEPTNRVGGALMLLVLVAAVLVPVAVLWGAWAAVLAAGLMAVGVGVCVMSTNNVVAALDRQTAAAQLLQQGAVNITQNWQATPWTPPPGGPPKGTAPPGTPVPRYGTGDPPPAPPTNVSELHPRDGGSRG